MKPDFDYDEFPGSFAHCLNEKCVVVIPAFGIRYGFVFLKRAEVYILSIRAPCISHRRRVSFLPARPTAAVRQRHNLPVR